MNVDQYAADAPPIRFVEAEKINPYQLLAELHDHALARRPTSSRA